MGDLDQSAVGLRLARIDRSERLLLCEPVRFVDGFPAVETTLRRAAIAGRVEVNGTIANHFADALDGNGDIVGTIALDARSYGVLKNRWMRCKVQRLPAPAKGSTP